MVKKVLDKEELIAQLKELSATTTRQEAFMGAMCYSPSKPPIERTKCEMCGADIVYEIWHGKRDTIYETVRNISNLGYDAKVEICCMKCAPEFITFACHAIAHFDFQGVSAIYWVS